MLTNVKSYTQTQINTLTASDGEMVYNSTTQGLMVRVSGAWVAVSSGGGGGVPEAPTDGQTYGRNNAAWTVVTGGGGSSNNYFPGGWT